MNTVNTISEYINTLNFKNIVGAIEPVAEDISTCLTKERIEGLESIILKENISNSRKFVLRKICEYWEEIPWKYKLKFATIFYFMAFISNNPFTFVALIGVTVSLQMKHSEFDGKFKP